jgi:ABC-type uncharacterized transport system permease subunit
MDGLEPQFAFRGKTKTGAFVGHPFVQPVSEPENSGFGSGFGFVDRSGVGVTPANLVALGSGAKLADLALGRRFESAAAAHFFEDAFGIQFGLEALQSTIDGLAFFDNHSTHAVKKSVLRLVPIGWGAETRSIEPVCQGGTVIISEKLNFPAILYDRARARPEGQEGRGKYLSGLAPRANGLHGGCAMDRIFLILSTLLAAVGGVLGMWSVHRGIRSKWTIVWMTGAFLCQLGFLTLRGEARAACPLRDHGEILAYLAWALTLFYLATGPAYRVSLLGVFTAPVVVVFQAVALLPGVLQAFPEKVAGTDPWRETHAALSVLSYGALALAGVAGVMFLVLDRQLKVHHLKSGLFRNLPPVRELLKSTVRLLWLGTILLTLGIVAGFLMPQTGSGRGHLIAAVATWIGYALLLMVKTTRGLTGRRLSLVAVGLFLVSLTVFAFV